MTNATRAFRWEPNSEIAPSEREQLEAELRRFLDNTPPDANERLARDYKALVERALRERKKEKAEESLAAL
jgi:hypothetical protein